MSEKPEHAPGRNSTAIVVALTVLAAGLRLPGLNSGLWFDEIVTLVESVRLPVSKLVTVFPDYSNNHPLYSLLAHLSVTSFGEHPWTVRLPAFLFGVACVPAMYRLAAAVTTQSEALLATLLMAVSYHAVWFSQNARGYTALMFFTLVTTLLSVRPVERWNRSWAVAYGTTLGLGLYTHLTMAPVAAAHAAVWGWRVMTAADAGARHRLFRLGALLFGIAALLTGLLYLPMAGPIYELFAHPPKTAAAIATPRSAFLEVLRGVRIGFGTISLIPVIALAVVGALSYLRQSVAVTTLFVLPGIITTAALLAMRAPVRPRFFFSLLVFAPVILVRGATESGRWVQRTVGGRAPRVEFVGVGAIVLLTVFSIWSLGFNYRFPKQDFDGAKAFVETHRALNEPVATSGLAVYPYKTYYRLPWIPVENAGDFEHVRQGAGRAWFVYSFPEYMDPTVVNQLQRLCKHAEVFPGTLGGGDVIVCAIEGHR